MISKHNIRIFLNTTILVFKFKKYVNSKFTDSKGAINIKPQKHKIDGGFAVRLINYEN